MDSTYILPIVIVVGVLAVFGIILWATSGFGLFKSGSGNGSGSGSGSDSGSGSNGTGDGFTPLGDLHVCVSQINNWITNAASVANANATGATGAHVLFYTALEGGVPSACSQLMLQLVDENGDSEIDFKWNNGAFYPSSDVSQYKKITDQDVLEFKVMDTMNCGGCACDLSKGQPCSNGGLCVNGKCYISQDFEVTQVVLNN